MAVPMKNSQVCYGWVCLDTSWKSGAFQILRMIIYLGLGLTLSDLGAQRLSLIHISEPTRPY